VNARKAINFQIDAAAFHSIGETSPVDGETGVAVIRETIVHFTAPLASNAVVTTDNFYAGYGDAKYCRVLSFRLIGRRQRSSIGNRYPAARVFTRFLMGGLTDELGRPLDPDSDGVAGGLAIIAFDTLNVTPLTGTAVIGQCLLRI